MADPGARQRGVALITVLLVTALAAVVVTAMLSRHQLAVAKTRQVLYAAQAREYALGAEAWARAVLASDLEDDSADPPVDALDDAWAAQRAPFEIEQGALEVAVRDLQGLMNLNVLGTPAGLDRMRRLLGALGLDPALAEAMRDWQDEDQDLTGAGGAEDGEYLLAEPPYRAANQPFAEVSELRLVAGMTEEAYGRLEPFVAALPPGVAAINVNTAPGPVLAALAPGMEPAAAAAYARPETPWGRPGELVGQEAGFAPEQGAMAVASQFFELWAEATFAEHRVTLRSVIHRDPETGATRVVGRDFGRRFDPALIRAEVPGIPGSEEDA